MIVYALKRYGTSAFCAFLLFVTSGPSASQSPSSQAWGEDIRFLASELEARHAG